MTDRLLSSSRSTEAAAADGEDVSEAARIVDVDICICTFQRPHVADTLASLARQTVVQPGFEGSPRWSLNLRIIVVDNDETPSGRHTVEAAFATHMLNGVYLHAPSRNISIARNACLDTVTAPLAAFIDDDEAARPDWIARLVNHIETTDADVAFGRVVAIYPDNAPDWLTVADMHSTQALVRGGVVDNGYAGNVLLRMAALGGLRFNLAYGQTGGEDTLFFNALHARGMRLSYCPEAVVEEPVAPTRMSLRWLMRRSYRAGQTHAAMLMQGGAQTPAVAGPALAKAFWCAVAALLGAWSAVRWRKAAVRGALHAGAVSTALGRRTLKLYGADAHERA